MPRLPQTKPESRFPPGNRGQLQRRLGRAYWNASFSGLASRIGGEKWPPCTDSVPSRCSAELRPRWPGRSERDDIRADDPVLLVGGCDIDA